MMLRLEAAFFFKNWVWDRGGWEREAVCYFAREKKKE